MRLDALAVMGRNVLVRRESAPKGALLSERRRPWAFGGAGAGGIALVGGRELVDFVGGGLVALGRCWLLHACCCVRCQE